MVYNTENTEWPSFKINSAVKNLISDFFLLLDNKDANVGDKLADDIFASKGEAKFGGHTFVGTDEIRKSRDNAWGPVTRRRHEVLKVFSANLEGDDLLFIGHVEMDFRNGKGVAGEFTGRLRVEDATGASPKLALYTIWADSAPVTKALKGE